MDFLNEVTKLLPTCRIEFYKHFETVVDPGDGQPVMLKFRDRTTAEVDTGISTHFVVHFQTFIRCR